MDNKYCPDCKETKPVGEFHRSAKSRDGRRTHCKPCTMLRYRAAALRRDKKEVKYCPLCRRDKPISEFHYNNKELGTYQSYCKRCRSRDQSRHDIVVSGAEHVKGGMVYCQICRQWKGGAHFPFIPKTINRHYGTCRECAKSPGVKWRAKNKGHLRIYGSAYRKTEQCKLTQAKNRHKRKTGNANNTLTVIEWETILSAQSNQCLSCGREFCDTLPPTKDHIIPATKGGSLTMQNCQALCLSCNSSKNDRDTDYRPDDWWSKINAILQD